jgi:hypothetical protein
MIDIEAFEELDDLPSTVNIKKPVLRKNKPQINLNNQSQEILGQMKEDREVDFPYSYTPSRFEGRWLIDSLGGFYEEHWFDDVLRMIKGGKEASVYLCRGNKTTGKDLLAAKVYRPRMFRNLKAGRIWMKPALRSLMTGRNVPLKNELNSG